MCKVCAAKAAQARQSSRSAREDQIRQLRELSKTPRGKSIITINGEVVGCHKPISYYENLDTSLWTPVEKALVVAQIKNYAKKCNLYHDKIQEIINFYSIGETLGQEPDSQILPSPSSPVEEHA